MYQFKYFNDVHLKTSLFFLIAGIIIIMLPYFIKGLEKTIYTPILGCLLLIVKFIDSGIRHVYENETFIEILPFNLCNIAIILAALYLIFKKNYLINIVYFFSLGAILAILLPGIKTYNTLIYPYSFMGAHSFELIALVYSFIYLGAKITKDGLKLSIIVYLIATFVAKYLNSITGLNFMYLNDYVIPQVSFIKPILLYDVLFTLLYILSMVVLYLPFAKTKTE